ncbi:MAG: DnaJ C-terminal domain-containing protein, partial [Acidimicrobiia bacterium]|nr:DnaJ C-terminal domain-containing protein [Acidimicrobiia bacterium]
IDLTDLFGGIGGLDDLLRSVFGNTGGFGRGAARQARGRDVLVRTTVTLEEAAFGTDATVEYSARTTCPECIGTGSAPGAGTRTCGDCGGTGQVRTSRRSAFGSMMSVTTCATCHGAGTVVTEPCPRCDGAGAVAHDVTVNVDVPAGISTGTRLRLSGRGESPGRGGVPGDLFVEVTVADDERFERRDANLIHHTRLGIAEATLGTRVAVPLLGGGTTELDVPPGTQPGTVLVIHGEGMTILGRRARGDLLVVVDVVIPTDLSPEQEEAIVKWAEVRGERIDRRAEI